MKFQIFRKSSIEAIPLRCYPHDCIYNAQDNRWEIEIQTSGALLAMVRAEGCPVLLLPDSEDEELPTIVLVDVND